MPRTPDVSIIGKTYNNLKVEALTDQRNNYGRRLYKCTCLLCGKSKLVTRENLLRDEIKDCGEHKYIDLSGKKFGRLEVKYVLPYRKGENRLWHCVCDCGNEVDVLRKDLLSGRQVSCGCVIKENMKNMYVENVNIPKFFNPKIRATNKSGVTGVCWNKEKEKWDVEIGFQKKRYKLGRYEDFNEAVKVRKEAEDALYGDFIKWYDEYCQSSNTVPKNKTVTDHLGNKYKSTKEMCKIYNVPFTTYKARIKRGLSKRQALTNNKIIKDFQHNNFKSIEEMCDFYGIKYITYIKRLNKGLTQKEALTKTVNSGNNKIILDHLGNEYESITAMCKYYNISLSTYRYRKNQGWTLEQVLTK